MDKFPLLASTLSRAADIDEVGRRVVKASCTVGKLQAVVLEKGEIAFLIRVNAHRATDVSSSL